MSDTDPRTEPDLTLDLSTLYKPALLEECRLRGQALEAAATAAPVDDPYRGLDVMTLRHSGGQFNNSLIRLVRCAMKGEHGDKWMVIAKGKTLTMSGHWAAVAMPWLSLPASLQDKVAFDLDKAIALADKIRL
jgi:hypothetical protein